MSGAIDSTGQLLDEYLKTFAVKAGDIVVQGQVYEPKRGRGYISSRVSGYQRFPGGASADAPMNISGVYEVLIHRPATEGRRRATLVATMMEAHWIRGTALDAGTGARLIISHASAQPVMPAADWITVPVVVSWFGFDSGGGGQAALDEFVLGLNVLG